MSTVQDKIYKSLNRGDLGLDELPWTKEGIWSIASANMFNCELAGFFLSLLRSTKVVGVLKSVKIQ
jgi:hypothetical protein